MNRRAKSIHSVIKTAVRRLAAAVMTADNSVNMNVLLRPLKSAGEFRAPPARRPDGRFDQSGEPPAGKYPQGRFGGSARRGDHLAKLGRGETPAPQEGRRAGQRLGSEFLGQLRRQAVLAGGGDARFEKRANQRRAASGKSRYTIHPFFLHLPDAAHRLKEPDGESKVLGGDAVARDRGRARPDQKRRVGHDADDPGAGEKLPEPCAGRAREDGDDALAPNRQTDPGCDFLHFLRFDREQDRRCLRGRQRGVGGHGAPERRRPAPLGGQRVGHHELAGLKDLACNQRVGNRVAHPARTQNRERFLQGDGDLGPKMSVPIRRSVAPSSMAISKSSLMPIESVSQTAPPSCVGRIDWNNSRTCRKQARIFSRSSVSGPMAMRPRSRIRSNSASDRTNAAAASGGTPCLAGSPVGSIWTRASMVRFSFSHSFWIARARSIRSRLWIIEKSRTAGRTLLVWSDPTRCQRMERSASCAALGTASCTRFSAISARPSRTATRTAAGGWPFATAMHAIPPGGRPARAAAARIRSLNRLIFSPMSVEFRMACSITA